ncbi:RelA/SpoT domain protein [Peptostreptococcaceae bacterium AS15]|nr:RelA/SpoT domain protein [[Eubacterium] yurii subsp. margaretiae ATCC 43715]EJP24166.1 RelA/SpoT domain protein [Peptostreptococcaceae bacterium AS15]
MQVYDEKLLTIMSLDSEGILENLSEFKDLMLHYKSAIRTVRTKLEILNDELSLKNSRNPIEFVKSRLKKPASIAQKLRRRNLDISVKSIKENLYDIAGIRVVCSFADDIYGIADVLASQDDVEVVEIKDYIKKPKPNGYSSYHMIIKVPIYLHDVKELIPIELQIRTIAMDFWASLEHKMKYKKSMDEAPQIINRLKECADSISEIDKKMLEIRKNIENMNIIQDDANY